MQNFVRIDSLKNLIPFFNSSKERLGSAISSFMANEADYLMKTDNTDKELKDLLVSGVEIEQVFALKLMITVSICKK
jgi:hypothetical protein